MALVQQQPVLGRQLVDPQQHTVLDCAQAAKRLANLRKDSESLAIAGARRERVALEISRQPDASGDDDVGVLARCIEPAGAAIGKQG